MKKSVLYLFPDRVDLLRAYSASLGQYQSHRAGPDGWAGCSY